MANAALAVELESCDGCGSPTCSDKHLCDVRWENYRPVRAGDRDHALAEIREAHHGETVALFESERDELASVAAMALADGVGRFAAVSEITALLKGTTIVEAARLLGVTPAIIVRQFTQTDETAVDDVLRAEGLLRARCGSYRDVAKASNLTFQQVQRLAMLLGFESIAAENVKNGGGYKYSAEQIAEAWQLKADGLSHAQIAVAMGLKDKNAAGAILRRHRMPTSVDVIVRGDDEVAA